MTKLYHININNSRNGRGDILTIKVLIVDDSLFIRVVLKDIIEKYSKNEIEVVGAVSDGREAIEEIRKNKDIDVITLDVRMPKMDGIETLREIEKIRHIPVLMISSYTKEGSDKAIEALMLGAVDFITKPHETESDDLYNITEEIIEKIKIASESKNSTYIFKNERKIIEREIEHIIAVGASTGGPSALKILLNTIPADFKEPIVIAQHIPSGIFVESLANNLNEHSKYKIKIIESGEKINFKTAYIAPGGHNVEIFKRGKNYHLILSKKTSETKYKPSVDLLFSSLARIKGLKKKTGVVLTGMGDDGLRGAIALESEGGTIIAESSRTAIVYGMPKKIAEYDFNKKVADINRIFRYIEK